MSPSLICSLSCSSEFKLILKISLEPDTLFTLFTSEEEGRDSERRPEARLRTSSRFSWSFNSYSAGLLTAPVTLTFFLIMGIKITSPGWSLASLLVSPFKRRSYRSYSWITLPFLFTCIFLREPFSLTPPEI